MQSQFYVYLHCKPNGEPFYVGKGSGNRAFRAGNRNNAGHRKFVDHYGIENIQIFVFPCESEVEALADEIRHISQLRSEGYSLVNVTDGGDGISGYRHSNGAKRKIAEAAAKQSREGLAKWWADRKGLPHASEWSAKIGDSQRGIKRGPMHENTKAALLKANLGKPLSEERRAKTARGMLGNKNALGRKISDETRERMVSSAKRREAAKREARAS